MFTIKEDDHSINMDESLNTDSELRGSYIESENEFL
jgi:hypothetical protein